MGPLAVQNGTLIPIKPFKYEDFRGRSVKGRHKVL